MANTLKPKRSATANLTPTTSNLASGEMGVNMADKKIFINNGTAVVQIGAGNLSGLGDVTLATPAPGESLVYNGEQWVNQTVSGGGGGSGGGLDGAVRYDIVQYLDDSQREIGRGNLGAQRYSRDVNALEYSVSEDYLNVSGFLRRRLNETFDYLDYVIGPLTYSEVVSGLGYTPANAATNTGDEDTDSIVTKLSTATEISDVSGNVRSIPQ